MHQYQTKTEPHASSAARIVRAACLAAMLAAVGAALAATDSTSTDTAVPMNSAPGTPGRAESARDMGSTGTAGSTDSTRQKVSDSTVTARVKAELLAAKGLKSMGIHVQTKDGVVSLGGNVPTEAQRTLAAQTARNVDGVASVSNAIKVVTK